MDLLPYEHLHLAQAPLAGSLRPPIISLLTPAKYQMTASEELRRWRERLGGGREPPVPARACPGDTDDGARKRMGGGGGGEGGGGGGKVGGVGGGGGGGEGG